jgi:hypothetical protein
MSTSQQANCRQRQPVYHFQRLSGVKCEEIRKKIQSVQRAAEIDEWHSQQWGLLEGDDQE